MRFLGIGEYCDLGDMYYRLAQAGHEVRVFIEDPAAHDIFGGMIERIHDWRAALGWIRPAVTEGIILFESAIKSQLHADVRQDGYKVIGASAFGERLENGAESGHHIPPHLWPHPTQPT